MAAPKIDKALYGPSLTEVALGAVLGLLVGVVAAGVYLVFKPVKVVKEMPKEVSRSVVYFVPGSSSNAKSKDWQNKRKQFLAGANVQLVEDESNAWAASGGGPPPPAPAPAGKPAAKPPAAKPAEKPKAGDKAAAKPDGPAPEGFIIPSTPNFHLANGKLQIGLTCTLNWYGLTHDVTVQATGDFRKSGDQFVFSPDTVYLGSCPLHLLPAAPGPLVATIISKQKIPDEMRTAWAKLNAVTIEGGTLKLAVQ